MNGQYQRTMRRRTYTRKDIAKRVASSNNITLSLAQKWVDDVIESIRDIMTHADPELRIELRDFGVFEVKLTKSKPKARNPQTGQIIYVPARRKTHFKPGKVLKAFLSQPLNGKHTAKPDDSAESTSENDAG